MGNNFNQGNYLTVVLALCMQCAGDREEYPGALRLSMGTRQRAGRGKGSEEEQATKLLK
jgi:hypothetical protein